MTRRELLCRSGMGMGPWRWAACWRTPGCLAARPAPPADGDVGRAAAVPSIAARTRSCPRLPPLRARAKRVVHLFMNGGPSHVDTFDPKPMLDRYNGKPVPTNLPTERKTGAAMGSPFRFKKYGQSGIEVSDLFAHTAGMIDDICVIRSMHADVPNHEPSLMLMNCGEARQARPCVGSWVLYGLGTENQNLPGLHRDVPRRLPDRRVAELAVGVPARDLPGDVHRQQAHRDREADRAHPEPRGRPAGPARPARPARRAQPAAPRPPPATRPSSRRGSSRSSWRTGCSRRRPTRSTSPRSPSIDPARCTGPGVHARQLLATRRLLERGVRFVQLWHGDGQPWDHHDDLATGHRELANQCDRPIAAFLKDLKQRGMLDDTLVIWGGEFGRTPTVELPTPGSNQGKMNGRDHNHYGFTMWMAGGGVKGGHVHGATDDFGFQAVENKVHVHDLHATMLHLLGFDHEQFTYRYAGRDFRLTDVHGKVVKDIIA